MMNLKNKIYELLYRIDRWKMDKNLIPEQDWSDFQLVFIISTGRTGTKFLARFLNQIPNVVSKHEPEPDKKIVDLGINYSRNIIGTQEAVQIIKNSRKAIYKELKRKNCDLYIESNNRLFSLIPVLRLAFEDPKIIHIVRDGREYVRSGMSRAWYRDKDKAYRLRAKYFSNDEYCDTWDEMDRFKKIIWRWKTKDEFIYEGLTNYDNYLRVKFENIFNNNHKGIYKIAEFIGIEKKMIQSLVDNMIENKINSTKNYEIKHWSQWSQNKKNTFDKLAKEHMEKYYDYCWD